MARFHTQAALDAHARTLLNPAQLEQFDALMKTGTWKVNKTMTDPVGRRTVVWLDATSGNHTIGLDLDGKIQRPVKGQNSVLFGRKSLTRVY